MALKLQFVPCFVLDVQAKGLVTCFSLSTSICMVVIYFSKGFHVFLVSSLATFFFQFLGLLIQPKSALFEAVLLEVTLDKYRCFALVGVSFLSWIVEEDFCSGTLTHRFVQSGGFLTDATG